MSKLKWSGATAAILAAVLFATVPDSAYADDSAVRVGILIPDSTIESTAAMHSVSDINGVLEMIGAEWRLEAVYPDDDVGFAEFIASSQEDGVTVFVGPGDTVSLLKAKEVIANTGYNAIYVGCCVPATHHDVLSDNDNVFVLAPGMLDQAAAVAAAMEKSGIEHAIPVYSGDLQSSRLRMSIATHFDGVMDSGVLLPASAIDYSPVVAAVSNKIESAQGKVAVLVLAPDATKELMMAGSALADVAWFGTSSESGLPDLGDASDFAESVDYTVPEFGLLREPAHVANLHYTQEARSAYDAIQIIAYTISDPTAEFVPFFARGVPMPVQTPMALDARNIAAALPRYAAAYGGLVGYTQMDPHGGLESAAYLLYGMRDGIWMKHAVYNPPLFTVVGASTVNGIHSYVHQLQPTHELYDVHTLGGLFPLSGSLGGPAEQRLTAASLALNVLNSANDGFGRNWYVDMIIEDTQTDPDVALEKLKRLDRLGIKMVVGPSASASAAAVREYANENDIVLLSLSTSHSLAIPGDTLYRVSPTSIHEVTVLTKMFERDGMEHVVAIHRQDLWGTTLVEGILSEFGGTLHTENGYDPKLANEDILDYERIAADVAEDVQALVEEHGESTVSVVLIGFQESAGILEAASHHPVLGSVQWYGSAGNANRLSIPANDVAAAFAESVNFMGPILMIDDGIFAQLGVRNLHVLHPEEPIDPYMYVTFDAVSVAAFSVGRLVELPASEAGPILDSALNISFFISSDGGLDENGDLADGNYDIWQIKDGSWHNTLVYDSDREKFFREVTVGVPVPRTDIQANFATARVMSYAIAVNGANEALAERGADWRLVLKVRNTAGDPQKSLEVVKSMHQEGISLLLGPSDDASLEAVRQYVEENNMLVLNCCSTSTALALPDRVFRLAPDDTKEADALNALLEERATDHLVTVYRDDAFGSSLNQAIAERFGGSTAEIPYDSDLANSIMLDYDSLAAQIAGAVQDATGDGNASVAVLLIGYEEAIGIMASALHHPILEDVKWYGTSGMANERLLVTDQRLAAFAEMVNYEATLFAEPPPHPKIVNVLNAILLAPNTYVYSTFDAVTLLATAVQFAGSDDAEAVAAALPLVANRVTGTLGSLALNANGDLDQSVYDVWHVRGGAWEKAATYDPDGGLEYLVP